MLVVTLGDPYSINCELVSSALSQKSHTLTRFAMTENVILVGSFWHWNDQTKELRTLPPLKNIRSLQEARPLGLSFLDIGGEERRASELSPKERGAIAVRSLTVLETIPTENHPGLKLLTCPIDKKACHEAGFLFPGHTEYCEALGRSSALMLLAGERLKVGLVTNHVAVQGISPAITAPLIVKKLSILYKTLVQRFKLERPRIAVCGLNPHCSDGGLFGHEEEEVIVPALEKFRQDEKLSPGTIAGPLAADTVFYKALSGHFDAVLAMYHDQGLGPLKTVHFDDAVNISCGLPFLRLSPDHGPAQDLFLKGLASRRSFDLAVKWVTL
ncbi:MAG: 4-hydroxythreonine-4-phosphate dehydrogenase PdxA [Deltaproteobacteria bacterium]|nr:4-hydroxythreonine-4-phosphate dehydrogenase PdxA [Deltaproteobacteria bacterium]